ncbi:MULTISPECIES: GNAT family N-acetyltransferase [unclassified Knoellia]|uniref:GNAT family N-acetyltransferase n=1 Tax=Knoellia altitudinis TaxID=3404795 RepID=UPI00361C4A78
MTAFTLRPVDPLADAPTLHRWVTHPKCRFWQMAYHDVAQVQQAYVEIDENPTHDAFLGLVDDEPAFLVERYDPAGDPVGEVYAVQPGDAGMHVLVAPTDSPVPGFTRDVFATVMDWLFEDPTVQRVVVEPDAANHAVHALNAWAGFTVHERVRLPGKDALLSFCTRDDHVASATRRGAAA